MARGVRWYLLSSVVFSAVAVLAGCSGGHFMAEVYLTAANFPPGGTAFAAGQLLSISANSPLFALIGTVYGGNGTTTFALPDLRRQAPGGLHYVIQTRGVFPSRG